MNLRVNQEIHVQFYEERVISTSARFSPAHQYRTTSSVTLHVLSRLFSSGGSRRLVPQALYRKLLHFAQSGLYITRNVHKRY